MAFDFDDQIEELSYKRNSRLNDRELSQANEHLINKCKEKYQKICCEKCYKTVNELNVFYIAKKELQGKKPNRIRPYLLVQEKYGRGLHAVDPQTNELIKFGNIEFNCYSCNQKYYKHTSDVKSTDTPTYQARKSQAVRPKFKNLLTNTLAKAEHICYKACMNKWSSDSVFQCSQDLLESSFQQEYDIIWEFIDEECDYEYCNGKHIILKDKPPIRNKSDYQVFLDEQDERSDV